MNFKVHTYGCKVNTYDSGLLENQLKHSATELSENSAVHILNSCAVTAEATRDVLKDARRIKAENPSATVVVTGCAAQVDTALIEAADSVDLVVANSHKGQLADLLRRHALGQSTGRVYKSNIFKKDDLEGGGGLSDGRTRAFLKIQDGCNSFCTFCVIPFARGRSRSLRIADLVVRARSLSAGGAREIVLTGVHIADYRDGESVLEDLVETLLVKTRGIDFRLSSLEPGELSPRLLGLYADQRLRPHFHLSIQSANSSVLLAMKRQYDAVAVEQSLEAIHRILPDAFVGMDVIAGFPSEEDEHFADSYARLANLPWTQLHVFPYSPRPGTYAARLNDLAGPVIRHARARRLRELSTARLSEKADAQTGRNKLGLGLGNGRAMTADYWTLVLDRPAIPNERVEAVVTKSLGGTKLAARRVTLDSNASTDATADRDLGARKGTGMGTEISTGREASTGAGVVDWAY